MKVFIITSKNATGNRISHLAYSSIMSKMQIKPFKNIGANKKLSATRRNPILLKVPSDSLIFIDSNSIKDG
jgi:hypothetical protein